MRIHLRFASWGWIPPADAGGGYRLPTPTQPVCQMDETSSSPFYLLSSAVCQREETRRLLAIKSVTGREAKALSA